jgi:hypothetical protein
MYGTEIENKKRTIVHFTCQERKKKGKKKTWVITHAQSKWCEHYPLVGTQHTPTIFFIKKFKKQYENIKTPLITHVNQCESKKKKKNLQVQTLFLVFSNYNKKLYSICMNCFYSVSFLFLNSE